MACLISYILQPRVWRNFANVTRFETIIFRTRRNVDAITGLNVRGVLMDLYVSGFNPFTPNDSYSGRTALLTSKRCILYIYSTNTGTEYFKHGIYSPFFFSLQNAVCFIILTYLVPV